jgi:hypothetical protein
LKVCAFNSDIHKNTHFDIDGLKLVHDVEQVEGMSRKELMCKKREARKSLECGNRPSHYRIHVY